MCIISFYLYFVRLKQDIHLKSETLPSVYKSYSSVLYNYFTYRILFTYTFMANAEHLSLQLDFCMRACKFWITRSCNTRLSGVRYRYTISMLIIFQARRKTAGSASSYVKRHDFKAMSTFTALWYASVKFYEPQKQRIIVIKKLYLHIISIKFYRHNKD